MVIFQNEDFGVEKELMIISLPTFKNLHPKMAKRKKGRKNYEIKHNSPAEMHSDLGNQ